MTKKEAEEKAMMNPGTAYMYEEAGEIGCITVMEPECLNCDNLMISDGGCQPVAICRKRGVILQVSEKNCIYHKWRQTNE